MSIGPLGHPLCVLGKAWGCQGCPWRCLGIPGVVLGGSGKAFSGHFEHKFGNMLDARINELFCVIFCKIFVFIILISVRLCVTLNKKSFKTRIEFRRRLRRRCWRSLETLQVGKVWYYLNKTFVFEERPLAPKAPPKQTFDAKMM